MNWPGWLTCSRWFTHISGHPSAAGRAQDRESWTPKDWRSTTVPRNLLLNFWATVWKTTRPMLTHRCLSCLLSCLSVTLVYCSQTVGFIRMPLGIKVGLHPDHIVLDGDPAHRFDFWHAWWYRRHDHPRQIILVQLVHGVWTPPILPFSIASAGRPHTVILVTLTLNLLQKD